MATTGYSLVQLPGGGCAVHARAYREAMHPGLGPAAEAETLYVGQLKLRERLREHRGEFVVWDVGLGAAANPLAALRATRDVRCSLRLVSFDNTLEPLAFALKQAEALGYLRGYETVVGQVLQERAAEFTEGARTVQWQLFVSDFSTLLASDVAATLPKPHAIFFDAFSPAKNPAMWTLPVFENLFRLLDPERPCALATYSRSTMVRVALLLGGFFVGRGRPSGVKEETTVAANRLELLDVPLDAVWLQRARKSGSAEPLREASYHQLPLLEESWARLCAHPQFSSGPR
jgi:tRNA U34 5-methylaminomethyl-2-thiouridine-forming methyltransferase MnmC